MRKGANDTPRKPSSVKSPRPRRLQNSDGYAVKWAMNRTKSFGSADARRMVFIISDGPRAALRPTAWEAATTCVRLG